MGQFIWIVPALIAVLCVFTYRMHRVPRPKPGVPTIVPSIMPWVGSAIAFNRNPREFFRTCKQTYGSAYRVLLAGTELVVLSHPAGISSLTRDTTKAFSTMHLHRRMIQALTGLTENLEYLFEVMDGRIFPVIARGLSPSTTGDFAEAINRGVYMQLLAIGNPESPTTLTLSNLISRPLYLAGCLTLFGPTFPLDTLADFQILDSAVPRLLTGLPLVARKAVRARERLLTSFIAFLEPRWDDERFTEIDGISDMVVNFLQELKSSQVSKREAAALLLSFIWGFHSNVWFMLFWLISQLLVDDHAMKMIREEVAASRSSSIKEGENITHTSNSPLMESAITETLRWATTATAVRVATRDTRIVMDGVATMIHKGDCVMGDVRAVHYDPLVFSDPDAFIIDRYLDLDAKPALPKPMAWGGGTHMCPGRHLAVFEIRQFMTALLQLYTIKAVIKEGEKVRLPRVNKREFVGTLGASEELYVEISPYTKKI